VHESLSPMGILRLEPHGPSLSRSVCSAAVLTSLYIRERA